MTHETGDVRQGIERSEAEKYLSDIWNLLSPKVQAHIMNLCPQGLDPVIAALRAVQPSEVERESAIERIISEEPLSQQAYIRAALKRVAVRVLESLASHPAPSGWQQRIAAMNPWRGDRCFFCGMERYKARLGWPSDMPFDPANPPHSPDCLWQNAADALPPAPEVKDPIAAAVEAELRPLADALIEAGHKLTKDAPPDTSDDLCMIPAPRMEESGQVPRKGE